MARLVLFGAGDIARLAWYYFTRDSPHDVVAFAVDAAYRNADSFCGLPVIDFENVVAEYPPSDFELFVALSYTGLNRVRADKYARAKSLGYQLPSYVSSRCTFLTDHPIGDNCFILEDNTIQPFVTLGNNITLWSGNHIGHDSVIEDHCFIASHVVISGHVRVGVYSFIGVNATIRNSVTIGPRTLIGAGAVIMSDTTESSAFIAQRTLPDARSSDRFAL